MALMAAARDLLQESVAGLGQAEAARALEFIRSLRVSPADIEWIRALAQKRDVTLPSVPPSQWAVRQPRKIKGPPISQQLIEDRRRPRPASTPALG
jgi:hypothetical protein